MPGVPIGVIHGGGKRASSGSWAGESGAMAEGRAKAVTVESSLGDILKAGVPDEAEQPDLA